MHARRTHPGFLSDNESARDRMRTRDFVLSLSRTNNNFQNRIEITPLKSKTSDKQEQVENISTSSEFWKSKKGLIVRAIVLNRAYNKSAILNATRLRDEDYRQAASELIQTNLLSKRPDGSLWVTRELYWQCKAYSQKGQGKVTQKQKSKDPDPKKPPQTSEFDNHIGREQFLLEFFGNFARDLGNPERWFTDNPRDVLSFMQENAKNRLPSFISVQPMKQKAQPLGIEKVFFDFDCFKNFETLNETETQKRTTELDVEFKSFLKQLNNRSIKPLIIKTRKGYHVHVFFDSVYEVGKEVEFWKQVYKQLQLELLQGGNYKFIDYAVIGDLNRMCRIPFSVHEKSGQECEIVNNELVQDKIRSIEYFKLYGLKQKDIMSAMEKARETEKTLKRKRITYVPRNPPFETLNGIRPCFVKSLNSGEMCHQQRLALLHEAYTLGFHSPESIINLFRCLNDFDESITQYQVNYFLAKWVPEGDYRPYRCQTIRKYGWCLGDGCPRNQKH